MSIKLIRISDIDLDTPLYRIFPLWFFEYALRVNGGCLALVPPALWEDPYEDICARVMMSAPDGSQKELSKYLSSAFAQCWSFEGDSDTLLRAYSRVSLDQITKRNMEPRYEGVQVKTTLRKLIDAVKAFLANRQDLHLSVHIGRVHYVADVAQLICNRLNAVGPTALGAGDERVQSLLVKRKAFEHEAEVRMIALAPLDAAWKTFNIDIDPNKVFEEVKFDSRLALFERREREKLVRDLGYQGPFGDSGHYQQALFLMRLEKHWSEYPSPRSRCRASG